MSKKQAGIRPSEYKKKGPAKPLIDKIPSSSDAIPEDEKLRLINETGLLQKVKKREAELEQQSTSTSEYIWQAIFLSIPFAFLMGTFDVTVKVQFSESWDYASLFMKCAKAAPALAPVIYLTNRYKSKKTTQFFMALGSTVIGAFLMYTLHRSPSMGQMMRAPGLATIWIYFIVQLDLLPAMMTLLLVFVYWFFGLRVV
ncbi:uncharacterized protein B0P05DRAFT_462901 [Gilbertella persicaria]|uniref:uncharacterized protein n=1 Tax=Gilbertella persicaria TaxID=101096 RepID=UPI00221F52BD|nr:uncharacterized protein B0P05DRAFT_462901 [Gilbertella persicaria]KAI8091243.1 hypothetical protein B0P05DRAFT_462901 [Gilbertella persicaria]